MLGLVKQKHATSDSAATTEQPGGSLVFRGKSRRLPEGRAGTMAAPLLRTHTHGKELF